MKYFNDKMVLVELLIEQYELKRMQFKIKKIECDNDKEEFLAKREKEIIEQFDENEYFIVNYEEEADQKEKCG